MRRMMPLLLVAACGGGPQPVAALPDAAVVDTQASDAAKTDADAKPDVPDIADVPDVIAVPDAGQVSDTVAPLDAPTATDVADVVPPVDLVMDMAGPADADAGAPEVVIDVAGYPSDVGFAPAPDAKAVPLGTCLVLMKTPSGVEMAKWATSTDVLGVDWTCPDPAKYQLKACGHGTTAEDPVTPMVHIYPPSPITYTEAPPTIGPHRPDWATFGEFAFLPEQRWLHNLEHGAVALLYHPCAPQAMVESLRAFAKAQVPLPGDPAYRQILSPYPNLPHAIALVTWGQIYYADCVQPQEMEAWLLAHYNKAAENEASPGGYYDLFLAPLTP